MSAKGTLIKKSFDLAKRAGSVVVPAYFAASEYKQSREAGKGVASSVASAGVDYVLGEALGFKGMLALGAAQTVPSLLVSGYQTVDRMSREASTQNANTPFMHSRFGDTQQAYTMRQHGMQLAQQSRYHLEQSLMGNEAQHFKY